MSQALLTAAALLREKRILAEETVRIHYSKVPAFDGFGESGWNKSIDDAESHIESLANALRFESPDLFLEYSAWCDDLFQNLNLPPKMMEIFYASLTTVLQTKLSTNLAEPALHLVSEALRQIEERERRPSPATTLAPNSIASRFQAALLLGKIPQALAIAKRAVQEGTPLETLYLEVFAASQHRLGELWMTGKISVAQEHYSSAATQLIMAQFFPEIMSTPKNGLRAVAACPAEELHEMGIRMLCDVFEISGWSTFFLGANVPKNAVLQAISLHQPHIFLGGATISKNVTSLESLISAIRLLPGAVPKILVGGYPFDIDKELWKKVGADGCAHDFHGALEKALNLLQSPQ